MITLLKVVATVVYLVGVFVFSALSYADDFDLFGAVWTGLVWPVLAPFALPFALGWLLRHPWRRLVLWFEKHL